MTQTAHELTPITARALAKCFAAAILLPAVLLVPLAGVVAVTPSVAHPYVAVPLVVCFSVIQFVGPFVACAWYPAQAYERRRNAQNLLIFIGSICLGAIAAFLSMLVSTAVAGVLGGGIALME
jgi:hypothetical protein